MISRLLQVQYSQVAYLSGSEPLAVEHAGVALLEAELLEEGVLGLIDEESAAAHFSRC